MRSIVWYRDTLPSVNWTIYLVVLDLLSLAVLGASGVLLWKTFKEG